MLLSIGLMVRNEEEHLEECLQSLLPILKEVDSELIIVDTGSTDRTLDIARRYTNRIYEHEWTDHFGEMRNIVLSYTRGEWFFFIDGDEVVEDAQGIIRFFRTDEHRKFNSGYIRLDSQHQTTGEDYSSFHAVRFFRNTEDFEFTGAIHEQPNTKGPAALIPGVLKHYGYLKDNLELMEYKFERNVTLLRKELEKDPENIYYLFQMSQTYGMYGDEKAALDYALKAYHLAKREGIESRQYVGERLAMTYWYNGKFTETESLCNEMLSLKGSNSLDLYFLLGNSQASMGKYNEAVVSFRKFVSLLRAFRDGRYKLGASRAIYSVNKEEEAYKALSSILHRQGKFQEALQYARLIQNPNVFKEHAAIFIDLCIRLELIDEINALFREWAEHSDVMNALENAVESQWLRIDTTVKSRLIETFKDMDSEYGLLNLVRANYHIGVSIAEETWEKIKCVDLKEREDYYAEFIFALIRSGQSIFALLDCSRHDFLSAYSYYLAKAYDEASEVILSYLKSSSHWGVYPDANVQRIKAYLAKGLLLAEKAKGATYGEIFECYLECGISFLEASYPPAVLDDAVISWMRNASDGFLAYMRLARRQEETSREYVRYLRLALSQDSRMKRGIDLLLKRFQEQLDNPEKDEMSVLKRYIQRAIREAINAGELETAVGLVNEYEEVVGLDAHLCSAKGIIYMIDGQLDDAMDMFRIGLELEPDNMDLHYNMDYLRNYSNQSTTDTPGVEKSESVRVLIGSPIRQKATVLREYLRSLEELDTFGLDVFYLFVDDNVDKKSTQLLQEFAKTHNNVAIHVVEPDGENYVVDEVTHRWKENLVWKVASFKDLIIDIANEFNYDYLFLVDSDLVLHPNTLQELIRSNKDIVSNVFWTRWHPSETCLPQVWIRDTYEQYHQKRDEQIGAEEKLVRRQLFLNRLKEPGVYPVGGLGACTLISRRAIVDGVKFSEIPNLSFWGEDRHFCVRAMALGFELFVNTKHPSYHIYRDQDLRGVDVYREMIASNKPLYRPLITLVQTSYSGCNARALFKNIPERVARQFTVELIKQSNSLEYYSKVMNSDVVVVTEGNYNLNKSMCNPNQIVVDLWHGFPLKAMGYEEVTADNTEALPLIWSNVDVIGSYSSLFNDLMERCIRAGEEKYAILGAPRNDLLIQSNGPENLLRVMKGKVDLSEHTVIVFAPTYRTVPSRPNRDGKKDWDNWFGFSHFDSKEFNEFLRDNRVHLLVKLHPAEEKVYRDSIQTFSNVSLLTNSDLEESDLDFYEILNATSALITDYSSVYFDYLLLDKPIVFASCDVEEYRANRGFLLEPYDEWTPGDKAVNQEDLEKAILDALANPGKHAGNRTRVRSVVHHFNDSNSSDRVWSLLARMVCGE